VLLEFELTAIFCNPQLTTLIPINKKLQSQCSKGIMNQIQLKPPTMTVSNKQQQQSLIPLSGVGYMDQITP